MIIKIENLRNILRSKKMPKPSILLWIKFLVGKISAFTKKVILHMFNFKSHEPSIIILN